MRKRKGETQIKSSELNVVKQTNKHIQIHFKRKLTSQRIALDADKIHCMLKFLMKIKSAKKQALWNINYEKKFRLLVQIAVFRRALHSE